VSLSVVWQGRPEAGPILQFNELMYSSGAALAPLVAIPFLSERQQLEDEGFNSTYNATVEKDWTIIYGNLSRNKPSRTPSTELIYRDLDADKSLSENVQSSSQVFNFTISTVTQDMLHLNNTTVPNNNEETNVQYIFIIAGALFATVGMIAFILFSKFSSCLPKHVLMDKRTNNEKEDNSNIKSNRVSRLKLFQFGFYISLSAFMMFCMSVNIGIPSFLVTFVYYYLKWTKEAGAFLATAFTCSGMGSCLLHIFLTTFISMDKLLLFGSIICTISSLMLVFLIHTHWFIIWACMILMGIGVYPSVGLMQNWGHRVIGADGRFQSFLNIGMYCSQLIFPSVMGLLFDTVGTVAFIYGVAVSSVGFLLCVVLLNLFEIKIKETEKLNKRLTKDCDSTLI
jgi:hypothetical protein